MLQTKGGDVRRTGSKQLPSSRIGSDNMNVDIIIDLAGNGHSPPRIPKYDPDKKDKEEEEIPGEKEHNRQMALTDE